MKKVMISESQAKRLIGNVLTEQSVEKDANSVIQCFLNQKFKTKFPTDGIIGDNTKKLIEKYQMSIGATVDGVWGEETAAKVKQNKVDFELMKKCGYQHRDIIDRIFMFLGLLDY